jgi:hypothetical protein
MSRRRQQSENALFIFCLLKNTIQPLGAKDFDLNQGAKLELLVIGYQYREISIQHQASSIQYPVSSILYPVSP